MKRPISQLVFRIYEALMWPSGLSRQKMGRSRIMVNATRAILALAHVTLLTLIFVWLYSNHCAEQSRWSGLQFSQTMGTAVFLCWIALNVVTVLVALLRVFPSRTEEACWLGFALTGSLFAILLIEVTFGSGSTRH